jgi:hypothetical protein
LSFLIYRFSSSDVYGSFLLVGKLTVGPSWRDKWLVKVKRLGERDVTLAPVCF